MLHNIIGAKLAFFIVLDMKIHQKKKLIKIFKSFVISKN